MSTFSIRPAQPDDQAAAYYVCLKTGDHGADGEPFYRDDPDALGRIFVGPYLAFEPELGLMLEDADGVCGYAFGAFDSRAFYARYESAVAAATVRAPSDAARATRPHGRAHRRCTPGITTPTTTAPNPTRPILRTCTSTCSSGRRAAGSDGR